MPYCVYVIELDKAFAEIRKAKEANPKARPEKPCIYVGYSSKTPLVRCLEHKNGARNSKGQRLYSTVAHKYYVRPRPRLYEKYNPIATQEEAMAKERELTDKYRRRGYTVWSN